MLPDWAVTTMEAVPRFGCAVLPYPPQPPIASPGHNDQPCCCGGQLRSSIISRIRATPQQQLKSAKGGEKSAEAGETNK